MSADNHHPPVEVEAKGISSVDQQHSDSNHESQSNRGFHLDNRGGRDTGFELRRAQAITRMMSAASNSVPCECSMTNGGVLQNGGGGGTDWKEGADCGCGGTRCEGGWRTNGGERGK